MDQSASIIATPRINATKQVVDTIKLAVQRGQLKVGDKLPREADLAAQLGVGRSSLREGIKILNAYGVVESRQGEGTFIVDNSAKNFFEFMGFFPSSENTANYLELRLVLEVGNIVSIYDKITDKDLDELEPLVNVLNRKGAIDEYVEADKAFHRALISYTKNPMIIQINNMIADIRTDSLYRLFCYPAIVEDAYTAHKRILNALRMRDLKECIAAVSTHIGTTQAHVVHIE